jgi:hypothetical protein
MRAAVLAAFRRARELKLGVEDVEKALAEGMPAASPAKGRARAKAALA